MTTFYLDFMPTLKKICHENALEVLLHHYTLVSLHHSEWQESIWMYYVAKGQIRVNKSDNWWNGDSNEFQFLSTVSFEQELRDYIAQMRGTLL